MHACIDRIIARFKTVPSQSSDDSHPLNIRRACIAGDRPESKRVK
jgi:hypothetical protein